MLSHPQKSLLDEQQKNSANVNVQVSCFRMDHLQLIGRIWRKTKKTHHRSLHRSSFTLFHHFPASAAPHWTEMTRACLHRALVERRLSGVPMLLLRPALLCQGVPWVCALRRCAVVLCCCGESWAKPRHTDQRCSRPPCSGHQPNHHQLCHRYARAMPLEYKVLVLYITGCFFNWYP